MRTIDLNSDTGEADRPDWLAVEDAVLPFVTSANIACGGHAGNEASMKRTVTLASHHQINLGAHPAYPDKKNFGRQTLIIGQDITKKALKGTLLKQITTLCEIAARQGQSINYVKAHGALYNDAVFDEEKAMLIAETVAVLDKNLWLMGAPNSCLTDAAAQTGLKFVAEGFVDRRYEDSGHLQSRKEDGAVLASQPERQAQAVSLLKRDPVKTASGNNLNLQVDTLCLHSDSAGADITAKNIRRALQDHGAEIKAFA